MTKSADPMPAATSSNPAAVEPPSGHVITLPRRCGKGFEDAFALPANKVTPAKRKAAAAPLGPGLLQSDWRRFCRYWRGTRRGGYRYPGMGEALQRIGTAGWSIASRYRDEFPPDGSHLQRYARRLNAAEVNSSFYKPHRHKTWQRWAASTPAGFRFSVKLPQAITHDARLVDCDALLDRFMAEVSGLGDRLGVLLVQLPPNVAFDAAVFDAFMAGLRGRSAVPIALEPRHASWFTGDVDAQLQALGIARVAADPAKAPGAGEPGGWRGLAYYRWHGAPRMYYSEYDGAALLALGQRIDAQRRQNVPVWCIFDNTASGAALGNALALASGDRQP